MYYYIEWGDGQVDEWIGPYKSGELAKVNHTWTSPDDYEIRAKAKDTNDAESEWSEVYPVTIVENEPPNAPIITGETNGKIGVEYEYTFNAEDPDGDNVKYFIDWGDGDPEETGFNPSGDDVKLKNTWNSKGTYTIRAYAEDEFGLVGPEGNLTVIITKKSRAITSPFLNFLQNHPNLLPILKLLLQRYLGLQ